MICVPYIINDNYKVAQLSTTDAPRPCYTVEKDARNSEVQLFSFEPKQFAFDPAVGFGDQHKNDFSFRVVKEACSVSKDPVNHSANIIIAIDAQPLAIDEKKKQVVRANQNFRTDDGIIVNERTVSFDYRDINAAPDDILVISIQLYETVKQLHYDFSVNVAPKENIFDIVIDFGSEASQVWIHRRYNDRGNMMELFQNIKERSDLENVADSEIYQFDPSSKGLYRSLFFLKSNITASGLHQSDMTFINRKGKITDILAQNVALPNMKLMDHSNVPLPTFRINGFTVNINEKIKEIRAEILKFFFNTALRRIDCTYSVPVACKITFLVPNTYTQATLSSVHSQLILDLQQLKQQEPFNNIKGDIEVSTFSESDASFFGWYSAGDFQKSDDQKNILIVDVGKGTTDFSVLRITSKNGQVTVERCARSGFVGAGNVMTFALLASVIRQIANEIGETNTAQIYDTIHDIAYHTDRALKRTLYEALEQIKCAPHISGRPTLAKCISEVDYTNLTALSQLNIERLTDILTNASAKKCFLQDDDPVVIRYAKQITDMLMRELRYVYDDNVPIDKLLLSGRGAMSQPLANAITAAFRKIDSKVEIVRLPPADTKAGCLKGPLNRSLYLDHMNMSIVGWPQQKRNLAMKRNKKKEEPKPDDTQKKEKKKSQNCFGRFISKYFGAGAQVVAITEGAGTIVSTGYTQEAMANSFNRTVIPSQQKVKWQEAQGTEYNIEEDTNLFVIGNRRCTANIANLAGATLGKKRMYFDGTDFLLRDVNSSTRFIPDPIHDDEGFLTETFFPMTELAGHVNVDMPQLRSILQTCNSQTNNSDDDFFAATSQTPTAAQPYQPADAPAAAQATSSTILTSTTIPDDDDFAAE